MLCRGTHLASVEGRSRESAFKLIRDGRRLEALRMCELLIARDVEEPHFRDALGSACTFCEEPAEALSHFEYAVKVDPSSYRSSVGVWKNYEAETFDETSRGRRDRCDPWQPSIRGPALQLVTLR